MRESQRAMASLEKRIQDLEAQISQNTKQPGHNRPAGSVFSRGRAKKRLLITACFAVLSIGLVMGTGEVLSQVTVDCENDGELFCFSANTPAKASEVNSNFQKIKNWLVQKTGPVGSDDITNTTITAREIMVDDLTVDGASLNVGPSTAVSGLGGCYTHWGGTNCAEGWDRVITGRAGGHESYDSATGGDYNNVECVSDVPSTRQSWSSDYWTRMFRADLDGDGMDSVTSECAICCRGGCYTALGTNTCDTANGYHPVYTGRTGGVETFDALNVHGKTLCLDDQAAPINTWTSGYYTRLMRHNNGTHSNSGGMEYVESTCAVCCR